MSIIGTVGDNRDNVWVLPRSPDVRTHFIPGHGDYSRLLFSAPAVEFLRTASSINCNTRHVIVTPCSAAMIRRRLRKWMGTRKLSATNRDSDPARRPFDSTSFSLDPQPLFAEVPGPVRIASLPNLGSAFLGGSPAELPPYLNV